MKFIKFFTLLIFTFFCLSAYSASAPSAAYVLPADTASIKPAAKVTPADIQRLTGKKLNWIQKLELKILQKKFKKKIEEDPELIAKSLRNGRMSLIFGLLAVALLFIPPLAIVSLISALLALIFGIKSLKYKSNTNGIIGIILGGGILFIFLLVLAVFLTTPVF